METVEKKAAATTEPLNEQAEDALWREYRRTQNPEIRDQLIQ